MSRPPSREDTGGGDASGDARAGGGGTGGGAVSARLDDAAAVAAAASALASGHLGRGGAPVYNQRGPSFASPSTAPSAPSAAVAGGATSSASPDTRTGAAASPTPSSGSAGSGNGAAAIAGPARSSVASSVGSVSSAGAGASSGAGIGGIGTVAAFDASDLFLDASSRAGTTGTSGGSKDRAHKTHVFSFGQNAYCELGHGDTAERHTPTLVDALEAKAVRQVAAGNEHTVVLCDDGEVLSCGYSDSGQTGVTDAEGDRIRRVSTLTPVEALRDKSIDFVHAANGCEHTLAVSTDGRLYTWGYNQRGQCGHGNTTQVRTPKLAELFVREGHRVIRAACSYHHTVVLTDGGVDAPALYACGRNDSGQLALGEVMVDRPLPKRVDALRDAGRVPLAMGCGQYHTVIALEDGGVVACGKNDQGQLGCDRLGPHVVPVPCAPPLHNAHVASVTCGYYHTVCVTAEGRAFSFGRNDYGQCGLGHADNVRTPQLVAALESEHVVSACAGSYHTLLLTDGGVVFAAGRNNHGQLGLGDTLNRPTPAEITGLSRGSHRASGVSAGSGGGGGAAGGGSYRATQVACGFYHSIVLCGPVSSDGYASSVASRLPTAGALSLTGRLNSLASDLRAMVNSPTASDVTFVVEGKPLYAHRCIVVARCEPLAAMLTGVMREAREGEVHISDTSYACFAAVVEFLYTGSVEVLDPDTVPLEFAMDLLGVADQYLVEQLKCLCESAIQRAITVDSVSTLFRIADARRALGLKQRCFLFMMVNFGRVIGQPSFTSLPPELLQEVLFEASKRGAYLRQ